MSRVWFGDGPAASADWNRVPTTTALVDVEPQLIEATEVWIDDPLAFPWDSLGESPHAPVTVHVNTSLLDLAGLAPWLETLTGGDRIVCHDQAIEQHLTARFETSPADSSASLADRTRIKTLHRVQADIVARLTAQAARRNETDRTLIEALPLETITSPSHGGSFSQTVAEQMATHGPGTVTGLWGVRESPGAPLGGAVIAYRLDHHDESGNE